MKRPSPRVAVLWTCAAILTVTGAWTSLGAEAAVTSSAPATAIQAGAQISVPQGSLYTPLLDRLRSILGLFLLALVAWLMSVDRKNIPWRVVIWGISLQILFVFLILKTPLGTEVFGVMNRVVIALLGFTVEGASFIFGDLVYDNVPVGAGTVGQGDFVATPGQVANTGAFFAFNVLPTIIFFSSLMTVLYHVGIMQIAVKGVAIVMQRTMRTSGAETLSAAGNIFVGQTEAPLLIKPFLDRGGEHQLQPRSIVIATYALSGFANFSSIAIQLGGIGGIAPSRRHDLSRLGLRAMIAGSIAAFMTATVAGMIL